MFACECRHPLTWSSSCGRTTEGRVSRLPACACLPSAIHRPAVAGALPACLPNRPAAAALVLPPQQPGSACEVAARATPACGQPSAVPFPVILFGPADSSASLKYLRAVRVMYEQLSPEVRTAPTRLSQELLLSCCPACAVCCMYPARPVNSLSCMATTGFDTLCVVRRARRVWLAEQFLLSLRVHTLPGMQTEEHRPLLPYLLLSGLEHPANVARFTPQMLRDAGAPLHQNTGLAEKPRVARVGCCAVQAWLEGRAGGRRGSRHCTAASLRACEPGTPLSKHLSTSQH